MMYLCPKFLCHSYMNLFVFFYIYDGCYRFKHHRSSPPPPPEASCLRRSQQEVQSHYKHSRSAVLHPYIINNLHFLSASSLLSDNSHTRFEELSSNSANQSSAVEVKCSSLFVPLNSTHIDGCWDTFIDKQTRREGSIVESSLISVEWMTETSEPDDVSPRVVNHDGQLSENHPNCDSYQSRTVDSTGGSHSAQQIPQSSFLKVPQETSPLHWSTAGVLESSKRSEPHCRSNSRAAQRYLDSLYKPRDMRNLSRLFS